MRKLHLEELINAFKTTQIGSDGLGVNPGLSLIKTSALSFFYFSLLVKNGGPLVEFVQKGKRPIS